MDNVILDGIGNVPIVKIDFSNEEIIEQTINNKELEQNALELRERYNSGSWIAAGDILIYKRLSEAYLRLIWALRRERSE